MTIIKQVSQYLFRLLGYEIRSYVPFLGNPINILNLAIQVRLSKNDEFVFVQIGANDGMRHDPLQSLIRKYHLKGLCVEPLPDIYLKFRENCRRPTFCIFPYTVQDRLIVILKQPSCTECAGKRGSSSEKQSIA